MIFITRWILVKTQNTPAVPTQVLSLGSTPACLQPERRAAGQNEPLQLDWGCYETLTVISQSVTSLMFNNNKRIQVMSWTGDDIRTKLDYRLCNLTLCGLYRIKVFVSSRQDHLLHLQRCLTGVAAPDNKVLNVNNESVWSVTLRQVCCYRKQWHHRTPAIFSPHLLLIVCRLQSLLRPVLRLKRDSFQSSAVIFPPSVNILYISQQLVPSEGQIDSEWDFCLNVSWSRKSSTQLLVTLNQGSVGLCGTEGRLWIQINSVKHDIKWPDSTERLS